MNDDYKRALGEAFRKRRKAERLSQQQLALMVGITRHTVHNIESGDGNPTLDVMIKLAQGLGIALSDIMRQGEATIEENHLRFRNGDGGYYPFIEYASMELAHPPNNKPATAK